MGNFGNSFFLMSSIMGGASRASYATGNAIYTAVQNARTKREVRKIYQQAADANYASRAVTAMPYVDKAQLLLGAGDDNDVYRCDTKSVTPALDYIWGPSPDPDSLVVSGGDPARRAQALMPFVRKLQTSQQNGSAGPVPIVVLHNGDQALEAMLAGNSVYLERVGARGLYYDAFRGMPVEDVASVLYEAMPDTTSPSAESLLRAVVEMTLRRSGSANFRTLAAYPVASLMDDLDAQMNAGQVDRDEYDSISRDYMSGTVSNDAVINFLNRLDRQTANVFGQPSPRRCAVKAALNKGGIVSFDLGTGTNDAAIDLLLQHLLYYQESGKTFALLVDGISVTRYDRLRRLLEGSCFALSHQDVIASLYGGRDQGSELFTQLMGSVSTIVLFSHRSSISCQRWSEHLGTYHKIKIRMSISQNNAYLSSNDGRGIQVEESDEPRIRHETIARLNGGMALIYRPEGILVAQL